MKVIHLLLYQVKTFKNLSGRIFLILPFFLLILSCINRTEEYPDYIYQAAERAVPETEADAISPAAEAVLMSRNVPQVRNKLPDPVERIKSFRAGCVIKTADTELALSNIRKAVKKYGGFIDSVNVRTVVAKVPAVNLHDAFEEVKTAGETVSEYIEAEDVTEDYYDLGGRIKLLEKSRARLTALLKYEQDIEKKLEILKEIKRVDDELERFKTIMLQLENRVKFSEITVDIIPYNEYEPDRQIPFRWIENLDPYRCTVKEVFRQVEIELPGDFAVLKNKRYFHGETSEGTLIRIGSVRNDPEGDAEFWQNALLHYLERYFSRAEKADSGRVKGAVFYSEGETA